MPRNRVCRASVRDGAIVLLFLDNGLRLSELAGLRTADLRADGSVKVLGDMSTQPPWMPKLSNAATASVRLRSVRLVAEVISDVTNDQPAALRIDGEVHPE